MKTKIWHTCKIMAIIISILAFTPFVIPEKIFEPILFGLPRTLWIGLLISLLFIILTAIGYFAGPDNLNQKNND